VKLLKQYREMHEKGSFNGRSLKKHVPEIGRLIKETDSKTILDYGSGKGVCHKDRTKVWGVEITQYDPAVKGIDVLPNHMFDAVICTDVLEHVPEDELDETLKNIFCRAEKLVYLSISTKPANKTLPNGLNAHVTVKPPEWWIEKVSAFKAPVVSINFD
jgi:hypothetical protein